MGFDYELYEAPDKKFGSMSEVFINIVQNHGDAADHDDDADDDYDADVENSAIGGDASR